MLLAAGHDELQPGGGLARGVPAGGGIQPGSQAPHHSGQP